MTETPQSFESRLTESLCHEFSLHSLAGPDETWRLESPFLLPDGQELPVLIEKLEDHWRFSDHGQLASYLSSEDLRLTKKRVQQVSKILGSFGATVSESFEISLNTKGEPGAIDVADFAQILIMARGLVLGAQPSPSSERYRQSLRPKIVKELRTLDYEEDWAPLEVDRELYKADLRVKSQTERDVVIFMSANTGAADRSALSLDRFRAVPNDISPVLVYNPEQVSSPAIKRFQDVAGNDDVLVAAEHGATSALLKALKKRDVSIA